MRYLEIIENIVNTCGTTKLPEQAKLALLICRLRESLPEILDRYCEVFDGEEALENAQDFTAVVMRLVEVGKRGGGCRLYPGTKSIGYAKLDQEGS